MNSQIKNRFAKVIRLLSIPPFMVLILLILLKINKPSIFKSDLEIFTLFIMLGIIPIMAYPLSKYIKNFKNEGRNGQRKLAFICTLIGYTFSFVFSLLYQSNAEIKLVTLSYFLAVVILSLINKFSTLRASGHACSFTSPIILSVLLIGYKYIFYEIIFAICIIWASLYLKRHTIQDLCGGMFVSVVSIIISYVLLF